MSRCYCLIFALVLLATAGSQGIAENWPGWRGLRGDGTSLESNLPTEWDGESGKNIRWKAAIPGSGFSSPVIHGDRIFLTSCDESEETRLLHCVDRKSGALICRPIHSAVRGGKPHAIAIPRASPTRRLRAQRVVVSMRCW